MVDLYMQASWLKNVLFSTFTDMLNLFSSNFFSVHLYEFLEHNLLKEKVLLRSIVRNFFKKFEDHSHR